jgi:hypothetical protein
MLFQRVLCFSLFFAFVQSKQSPVIQKLPGTSDVVAGQKFKIACALASGSLPVDFSWFKGEEVIVSGEHVVIKNVEEDTSVLNINAVEQTDAGLYKCVATNSAGSDFNNVQVTVKG